MNASIRSGGRPPSASSAPSASGPSRGSGGNGTSTTSGSFRPPTLQSDTVVFQAAKIPLSSSRLTSTPGSVSGSTSSGGGAGAGMGSDARYNGPRSRPHSASSAHSPSPSSRHHEYAPPPSRSLAPSSFRDEYDRPPPSHSPSGRAHRSELYANSMARYAREEYAHHRHHQHHHAMKRETYGHTAHDPHGVARHPHHEQLRHHHEFHRSQSSESISMRSDRSAPAALPSLMARGGGSHHPVKRSASDAGPSDPSTTTSHTDGNLPSRGNEQQSTRSASPGHRERGRPRESENQHANTRVVRMTIRVMKEGDKLGFGIRNDPNRKLRVSTLQSNSSAANSSLQIGDTLLSVNGVDLSNLGFLEVIQQLKAMKPGELVFDIERSLDESATGAGPGGNVPSAGGSTPASAYQQGESMDLDAPLSVTEQRFGKRRMSPSREGQPSTSSMAPSPHLERPLPTLSDQPLSLTEINHPGAMEPPRKRARPPSTGMTVAQLEAELVRMEKHHRSVMNAMSMELQRESSEKLSLLERNASLRKRLQKMLIECDDVRVKASTAVALVKDKAQREIEALHAKLSAARAELRLQDRGPDVARTDAIVTDLTSVRVQYDRLKKADITRSARLLARFNVETRHAEYEVLRVREQLIAFVRSQLREIARRHFGVAGGKMLPSGSSSSGSGGPTNSGSGSTSTGGGSSTSNSNDRVSVKFDGIRRLAFTKMFGLPCSFEWYCSEEFYSAQPIRHALEQPENILDVFGNALHHEERAGIFLVATAPMDVTFDPNKERVTIVCDWKEQNQIRELARNFRF